MASHSNILAWKIPWTEEPWAAAHRFRESDLSERLSMCAHTHTHTHGYLKLLRDFPGGPVVKISPSNAGSVGLIPAQGAGIPYACGQKKKTKT